MKLFTKDIDKKLFAQYPKGSNLENQMVVAKIFNPYGRGTWYILNSDPEDPDYLWAIVDLMDVEMGSVSRMELENIKVPPFRLGLERDIYFDPINAKEVYDGLMKGERFEKGGEIKKGDYVIVDNPYWVASLGIEKPVRRKVSMVIDGDVFFVDGSNSQMKYVKKMEEGGEIEDEQSENKQMLLNRAEGFEHHAEELEAAAKKADHIPAWVVAKAERASSDLSDITHYLDGENEQKREMEEGEEEDEYARGGRLEVGKYYKTKDGKSLRYTGESSDPEKGAFIDKEQNFYKISYEEIMAKGGEIDPPNIKFYKWYKDWIKGLSGDVIVFMSIPNRISSPVKHDNGKIVILDQIEKRGDTDAKKYMNEILKKADEFGVSIYLEPKPRTHYLKSEDHKNKITKDYLIKYYEKFGFKNMNGGFMVREPKMASGGMMKEGGVTGDVHSLTDKLLSQKIQIFIDKVKPIKYYYIDEKSNSLVIGLDGNYTQDAADKFYKEATSSMEFFDADSVDMEYMPKTKDTQYIIKLKKPVKFASGGMMDKGGEIEHKYYVSYASVSKKGFDLYSTDGNEEIFIGNYPTLKEANEVARNKGLEKKPMYMRMNGGMMAKGGETDEKWIQKAINPKKKGALREEAKRLGLIKGDEKLSMEVLKKLVAKGGKTAQRARLAMKLKQFAMGGEVKFEDKVKSVKKSLLERKKVPENLQDEYGKTYSPKEAENAAKRIVGAQTYRERLMKRIKKAKKSKK